MTLPTIDMAAELKRLSDSLNRAAELLRKRYRRLGDEKGEVSGDE